LSLFPSSASYAASAEAASQFANPQQVFPLAKFALKAQALGDLECRDDTSLDLLAKISQQFRTFAGTSSEIDRGERQISRARRVPIEVGSVAFRGSL
jgi:hypothetical protein